MKHLLIPIFTSIGVIMVYLTYFVLLILLVLWLFSWKEAMEIMGRCETPAEIYKSLKE